MAEQDKPARNVRDKKKVTDKGEIVKERKGMKRTNKPVMLPNNPTWLKQPTLLTMLSADFNTLHLRVLISLVNKIQNSIEQSIKNVPTQQLSLFKEQPYSDRILVVIPTKDFGIAPDSYPELRKALLQLATIPVELDTKDPITGAESWSVAGLFKAYIPKEKHRRTITVELDENVAKALVNVEKGFTKYIKEIAFQSQSKYTVRMYLLISSWKDKGGFSITLNRFRKLLKLENKYQKYKDLYKRVIRPVYEELFEKANCWFEVAEVYKDGESNPYKLNFKVVRAALTIQEEEYLKAQTNSVVALMTRHLHMEDRHIKQIVPLFNINNVGNAAQKVLTLCDYVKEHWQEITSISDYCTNVMIKELTPSEGIIGDDDDE
jgi:plasmid replication initiation protein